MSRTVSWFSCGAASAVATKLTSPDVIAYCDTGSEDFDNARFMLDCEKWFGMEVTKLKSEKYADVWDVWEKKRYIAGIADAPDVARAQILRENWPNLNIITPLIDRGITKAGCFSMIQSAGLVLPRVYAMGFPNANCIPCCKATSPDYWSLVRMHYPEKFIRLAELSRELGARLSRINNERIFIDEIPSDWPVTQAIAPECDFLCSIAEQDLL